MTHPLFFPFTVVPPRVAEVIVGCFGALDVLSPLETTHAGDAPGIRRIVPVIGDEDRLTLFIEEYRRFAAVNREKASAFLMGSGEPSPRDTDSASGIRSDILARAEGRLTARPETADDGEAHKQFLARAFLQIAQDWDEANAAIDSELDAVVRRERQLLEQLKGDDDEALEGLGLPKGPTGTSPESRIPLRLAAWARLFLSAPSDTGTRGPAFFLTHSPDVIAHLEECTCPLDHVSDLDLSAADREQALQTITAIQDGTATADRPCAAAGPVTLSLYRAAGISPDVFFSRPAGLSEAALRSECGSENTVIGLITVRQHSIIMPK
ncbi:hypothetical protein JCM14469_24390 [Desulfatiferula olefinivorans]